MRLGSISKMSEEDEKIFMLWSVVTVHAKYPTLKRMTQSSGVPRDLK